jgi:hypothetical protein
MRYLSKLTYENEAVGVGPMQFLEFPDDTSVIGEKG